MTVNESLSRLLALLNFKGGEVLTLDADDVSDFPKEHFELFVKHGILQTIADTRHVVCDGCDERCDRPVQIYRANHTSPARAFVLCELRDDVGRVAIDFERLKQWQMTERQLAEMVRDLIGQTSQGFVKDGVFWRLGVINGGQHKAQVSLQFDGNGVVVSGGHKVPLMELLSLDKDALRIDLEKIRKMVNEPTGFSDDVESTKARNVRLLKRRNELKSKGVRNFNQQIASEENLSLAAVKNAIKSAEEEQKAQSSPQTSNKFKSLLPAQSSQSKK